MGHAEGKLTAQPVHDGGHERLAGGEKLNFLGHRGHTPRGVLLDGGHKGLEAAGGVVEAGDGLGQLLGGEVGQSGLELTEAHTRLTEESGGLDGVVGGGVLHKAVGSPRAALGVGVEEGAVVGGDDIQHAAGGVDALGLVASADVSGDQTDVLHEGHGILEGYGVDALEHVAGSGLILPHVQTVGDVDVARGQLLDGDGSTAQIKVGGNGENGIVVDHI